MSIITINNKIKDYLVKNNLNILTLKKYNLLKSEIFDKFDFERIMYAYDVPGKQISAVLCIKIAYDAWRRDQFLCKEKEK